MSRPCGSCGADVDWAVLPSGKRVPLDAGPVEDGNLAVHRDPRTRELKARPLGAAHDPPAPWERRGRSHFATCPDADRHRRKK